MKFKKVPLDCGEGRAHPSRRGFSTVSLHACSGVKMQQYLHLRSEVDSARYTPAAYLQAVGGWRQRKHLAQLRTRSRWLAVEAGRYGNA